MKTGPSARLCAPQEVALHGRSLEAVGPLLGAACRGLRILYLQNNVIGRIGEWVVVGTGDAWFGAQRGAVYVERRASRRSCVDRPCDAPLAVCLHVRVSPEHLHRLKQLEYLNLALNNIQQARLWEGRLRTRPRPLGQSTPRR